LKGLKIVATGRYVPDTAVTNDDMAKLVDTNDEWISSRTGIRQRRLAAGEPTSFMAVEAAKRALEAFSGEAEEIDLIVCSTITPDFHTPSVACLVARALGLKGAAAFDVSAACSGFVYALDIAQKYLETGAAKTALVLSAETLSHITNFEDRSTCVLFGDGAGACIVQPSDGRYASILGADAETAHVLYATIPYPPTPFEKEEALAKGRAFEVVNDGFIHMDGTEVYKFSTEAMPACIQAACEKLGVQPEALGLIIPHQANLRIVRTAMKRLGLPEDRAYLNIDRYGNTSSASIPLALDEANQEGRLQPGSLVALVGFGAGLTYGCALFSW
jgi:3-oxoacyl-[acyl-carrier-protein] synthase-3